MSVEKDLVQALLQEGEATQSIWSYTIAIACSLPSTPRVGDYGGNKAGFNKAFNKAFTSMLPDTLVPVSGTNRQGKEINLHKKSGEVKWSAWSGSARMMQNLSDIGTATFLGIDYVETTSRASLRESIKQTTVGMAKPVTPPVVTSGLGPSAVQSTTTDELCKELESRGAFPQVKALYLKLLEAKHDSA